MPGDPNLPNPHRRNFLRGSAGVAIAPFAVRAARAEIPALDASEDARALTAVGMTVNGQRRRLSVDARTSLLDALRDQAGLTGAKKGCDQGQCGACTVHVDRRRILSCLMFAVASDGADITTIEGLAGEDGALHPMQASFIDQDAFQCGFCTPGQILSAVACVKEGHAETEADIREYMSGNLCRCAAYPNIVAAIRQAKPLMEG
ncbi:(2Fe-2S)-binding protein [Shinella sp. CPCC 101442]|uniref:(2Fe-2S)-binding protein n=1 Tax=Shinella sp. CPCC 101442 TaxID=2932265 RepID=UPI0035B539C0